MTFGKWGRFHAKHGHCLAQVVRPGQPGGVDHPLSAANFLARAGTPQASIGRSPNPSDSGSRGAGTTGSRTSAGCTGESGPHRPHYFRATVWVEHAVPNGWSEDPKTAPTLTSPSVPGVSSLQLHLAASWMRNWRGRRGSGRGNSLTHRPECPTGDRWLLEGFYIGLLCSPLVTETARAQISSEGSPSSQWARMQCWQSW